jgi:hypothetical protein
MRPGLGNLKITGMILRCQGRRVEGCEMYRSSGGERLTAAQGVAAGGAARAAYFRRPVMRLFEPNLFVIRAFSESAGRLGELRVFPQLSRMRFFPPQVRAFRRGPASSKTPTGLNCGTRTGTYKICLAQTSFSRRGTTARWG